MSKDRKNKTSKYTGVSLNNLGVYRANIKFKDKQIYLGYFNSEEGANIYYQNALKAIENGEEIVVKRLKSSYKYRGVHFLKNENVWKAGVTINGKYNYVGKFDSEEEAFKAREKCISIINKRQ
jgi:hypothetical protein